MTELLVYSSRLEFFAMAQSAVSSKRNSKQPANNQASPTAADDAPITEEELKKKTPITVSDVLRLRTATKGIIEKHVLEKFKIGFHVL